MTIDSKRNKPASSEEFEFESMNLQIGIRLQLLTHRGIKPVQYFSTLIGYVKDEYILVKMPFEDGLPVSLHEGEKLTVRVFSGTNVCTFVSTANRIFLQPFFYMHLSFPKAIQSTSLRVAMRVKVNVPARVTESGSNGNASAASVILSNLSVGGALIESEQELGKNQEFFDLSFALVTQHGDHQVQINTKVKIQNANAIKTSDATAQRDIFTYGVQFIDLDPTYQIMLQNLTYEALVGNRQKIV